MPEFPHLKLPFKVDGILKPSGKRPRNNKSEITLNNKRNRQEHGDYLNNSAQSLNKRWVELKEEKERQGILTPNEKDIPIFLKVDTSAFNIDSLSNWGIEVISEEPNGYIIGASVDNLTTFQEKVNKFLTNEGKYKDTASKIWEIKTDENWRREELLKGDLKSIWDNLQDEVIYTVELGVSCYIHNKKNYPNSSELTPEEYDQKVQEFIEHEMALNILRDAKQLEREAEIDKYLQIYRGELYDIWDNETDAIYFKISINGLGLRDIVITYQYLFEVKLSATYNINNNSEILIDDYQFEILGPGENAAKVCIIDSGIQEDHRLLSLAIDTETSRSYVENDDSKADHVMVSGHGTKVAGAVLYPYFIPKDGQYQLESIIQNARILDRTNRISDTKFVPSLLEQIVEDYSETKIFNLSVAEDSAYFGTHMPALAASIDKLIHEKDILFVLASGNLYERSEVEGNPGIIDHIINEKVYPNYLDEITSKIANPGVSYFAITVGSISMSTYEDEDYKSIASEGFISPFSRTGLGMWGNIKPDVVEFGGDLAINKNSPQIKIQAELCPELVNSTLHNASAVGKDAYGTSYSAPKVTYIVSKLHAEHPNENAQMYRALVIQSARLPRHCFDNPTLNDIRRYGYGVPDLNRALNNTSNRITFIQDGKVKPKNADIYKLNIPTELRGEGKNFKILVEVTLTFTAKTRLTRKGSHSYLSNWLEWQSSKYNESFISFRTRTIEYLQLDDETVEQGEIEEGLNSIRWCLRENPAYSRNEINRNNSTAQKSWAIIEPHQFGEEFSISVIGHVGWDKNLDNETHYSLCVSFEAVGAELEVYKLLSEAQIAIEQEVEN
ncbi:S8 family peptidase [Chryseobacterium sp.]|uniref:S8 family peptidase n=1 Tax=Chryseobacterium sp. TaxID=1871047 RepID=UPI00289B9D14|nr:S8 family peptidase [Chryseobacterium sp.]